MLRMTTGEIQVLEGWVRRRKFVSFISLLTGRVLATDKGPRRRIG